MPLIHTQQSQQSALQRTGKRRFIFRFVDDAFVIYMLLDEHRLEFKILNFIDGIICNRLRYRPSVFDVLQLAYAVGVYGTIAVCRLSVTDVLWPSVWS